MENNTIYLSESQEICYSSIFGIEKKENNTSKNSNKTCIAAKLVKIAQEYCIFFKDKNGDTYAQTKNAYQKQCISTRSEEFKTLLMRLYYNISHQIVPEKHLKTAILTITGIAQFSNNVKDVYIRVADVENKIYIDLCDAAYRAIEVSENGWKIIDNPPVCFVRTQYMQSLPVPEENGCLDDIWQLINIPEKYRKMFLVWLLECYRTRTPYPILELFGPEGSAKSVTQKFIRQFVDPHASSLSTPPENIDEDIYITSQKMHLLCFDNMSYMTSKMQDAFCCVATGATRTKRLLYTTTDLVVFDVKSPVIWSSINPLVTRTDLISRLISIKLDKLKVRRTEEDLNIYYKTHCNKIFGAILDLLVKALSSIKTINFAGTTENSDDYTPLQVPRLIDFARLGEAVYTALGAGKYRFLQEYNEMQKEGVLSALDTNSIYNAINNYFSDKHDDDEQESNVTTRASEDRKRGFLEDQMGNVMVLLSRFALSKDFPTDIYKFRNELDRIENSLKKAGFEVQRLGRKKDGIHIKIINHNAATDQV